MIKGWLIYSDVDANKNNSFIDWFIEEAAKQNIHLQLILREQITIGIINNQKVIKINEQAEKFPDFAIVRTVEPVLSFHLEACNVKVFNNAAISQLANNKSFTHMKINELNIPMVDTIMMKKENLTEVPPLNFPFVVKESTGRSGKQVYLISDQSSWSHCLAQLSSGDLVIQDCHVEQGKDVRIFVVGKKIVGAVLRESDNDFRANFTLGGSARWYDLNNEETEMIQRIIDHFEFGMVGIDFLVGKDGGLLFNEIEDIVGSRILSKVSDKNILKEYVSYIKSNI